VGSSSAYGQVLTTQGGEGQLSNTETSVTSSGTLASLYKLPTKNADGSTTSTFGAVRNTIGGNRAIEMSIHLTY
jgi:hypothetical protein